MLGNTQTEVLRILVEARNEATGTLMAAAAEVEGVGQRIHNAGKMMVAGGAALTGVSVGLASAVGVLATHAAKWEYATQTLASNTNMGAKGLAEMRKQALLLATQTGMDPEKIAEGYMHIANHAYAGAAALNILTAATRNAAATGGDPNEDANVLAGVLREYNVSAQALASNAQLATRYMDVLHNAVANSNWTMGDFVEGSKRAIATAGAFGVPISQVTAQLAILSEHGFPTAHVAALNWAGMLRSLEAPTAKGLKGMQSLSKATGVDLVGDIKRLQKDGAFLPQFLDDIQRATGGDFNKIRTMMTQSSYATALMALVRNHHELARVQSITGAAQAGRTLPGMVGTNESFAAEQATFIGQQKDFHQALNATALSIGTALLPAVTHLLQAVTPLLARFSAWAQAHSGLIAKALLLGTALTGIAGVALTVGGAVALLVTVLNPVGLAITALVLGAGLLAAAWATNFGHIRTVTTGVLHALAPAFGALLGAARAAWAGLQHAWAVAWAYVKPSLEAAMAAVVRFAHHILPTLGPAAHNVFAFLQGAVALLGRVWRLAWDGIALQLRGAWDVIKGVVQVAWALVSGIISVGLDVISGKWDRIWGDLVAEYRGVWNGIVAIVKGAGKLLLGAIQALLNGALGVIGTFFPKFAQAGKHLIDGLVQGIKSMGHHVTHAVKDFAHKHIVTPVKEFFHIRSPSGVFAVIGENLMAGLAQGITGSSALATTAVNNAMSGTVQAGEHWVKSYMVRAHHVAAHMIAGHYTHAGHWVKAHLVRAHEIAAHLVAGHWAHNPGHAATVAAALTGGAASASTLAGAATAGAGGVQLVALVSAAGSPLEPLPVTLVNAAGQALAQAGGAASAALAGSGGSTGASAAASALRRGAGAAGLPIGHGMGHEGVYGDTGAALTPRSSVGRVPFGSGAVHVAVHVHDGAVRVSSTGSPDGAVMGNVVGNAVVDALQSLAESQSRSTPPARRTLPGAI